MAINGIIDLRSDTLTVPTPAMREAMAAAEVGDDVFGEDPTVNKLQEMAAQMLGQEAGLLVSTGTMGNLASILAHCGRGDELICGDQSHIFFYEQGGMAALASVQPRTLPNQPDGTLRLEDIAAAIRSDDQHFPITRLVALENTHNRMGGAVLTPEYVKSVADLAHSRGLKLHIDGARLFNAAAVLGVPVRELTQRADSVTFCLSKGLSAPVGSVLVGSREFVKRAHRARKVLGGGMRQAGVIAAAGVVALEQMTARMVEDHANARMLADMLAQVPGLVVDLARVQSNMVYFDLAPELPFDAAELCRRATAERVRMMPTAARRIRAVLHCWVNADEARTAAQVIAA
ncbi:MAG: low-specificity L-threonine aldolase, partial [Chloroflexi bacterium]|nr:low-specificity L-threonine aldolase [Chloroflexota bacterium]